MPEGEQGDGPPAATGPVLFAYDGSDLAKAAIAEAGLLLTPSRHQAVVLTVWQPFNVGFVTPGEIELDAAAAQEVRTAAEESAAQGAKLAEAAGFKARSMAREGAPAKEGILKTAEELDSCLIVLGSHGRSGLGQVLIGSVAQGVAAHARRPVLIIH